LRCSPPRCPFFVHHRILLAHPASCAHLKRPKGAASLVQIAGISPPKREKRTRFACCRRYSGREKVGMRRVEHRACLRISSLATGAISLFTHPLAAPLGGCWTHYTHSLPRTSTSTSTSTMASAHSTGSLKGAASPAHNNLSHSILRPSSPYPDPRQLGPKSQLLAQGTSNYHSTSLRNSEYLPACLSTCLPAYPPACLGILCSARCKANLPITSGVQQPQRQPHRSVLSLLT
jgi:hypothetical protein